MIERKVEVRTAAGVMGTFVCAPERHGPHPLVLFLMDAPGIRGELRDMARRLASVGYTVLLPNLYYRAGVEELFKGPNAKSRDEMFALMNALTIDDVHRPTSPRCSPSPMRTRPRRTGPPGSSAIA